MCIRDRTTILTEIAKGVARNPELSLITCLVAERPEEVTEIRRRVPGLVLAADLDMPASEHIRVADLGIEHGKRLAEEGEHVVLLLDSLTRLARAHNLNIRGGGLSIGRGGLGSVSYTHLDVYKRQDHHVPTAAPELPGQFQGALVGLGA